MSKGRSANPQSSIPVLRASEIGQYLYCHRAWWLHQVQGVPLANVRELAAGTARHAAHGRQVALAVWSRRAAVVLLVLGIVLAVVAVVMVRGP